MWTQRSKKKIQDDRLRKDTPYRLGRYEIIEKENGEVLSSCRESCLPEWGLIRDNDGFSWINGKIQINSQVDTEIRLSPTHGISNIFYYAYLIGGRPSDC